MSDSQPPSTPHARTSAERRQARQDSGAWRSQVVARFSAALTPDERAGILAELDLPHTLDEDSALVLYRAQPQQSSTFIQRHLPRGRRSDDPYAPWLRLMAEAQARQDSALRFALYRAQATPEQWMRDTSRLTTDAPSLADELDQRHPNRWHPDIAPHLAQLALQRGAGVVPYLVRRAQDVWSVKRRNGYQTLVDLSQREGWWQLWAALLRCCVQAPEYDRTVAGLVADRDSDEALLQQRLLYLSGTEPDAAAAGRFMALRDATLVALYQRFSHLARGPFRAQLDPSPARPLSGLIQSAIEQRDEELIDHLCGRLAVRAERSGAERLVQLAALVAGYLEQVSPDAETLLRRACTILLRVPARAIHNQRELMRRNPLARLLFERAGEACLALPEAAGDLLQADETHVRAIAVRALASSDPRALPLARQNRDRLLAALDDRLPRSVARQAVRMLDQVAGDAAAQIVAWARAALARPGSRYPTDELVALLGRQLQRHPALRDQGEVPAVYRRTVA